MQTYDIIMLVVLGVAVGFGLWKGLAWQLASLASLFASYVVAFLFRDQVAAYITATPPWNIFLAMLILYVATALGIWVVFHIVSGVIDKLKLKEFDSQLGGLFGLAKGVVLCGVITLFAITLLGDDMKKTILSSHSGYYLAHGLDKLDAIMPPQLHDVVAPYLHPISEEVGNHPHDQAATTPPPAGVAVAPAPAGAPALPPLSMAKEFLAGFTQAAKPQESAQPPAQPAATVPVQPASEQPMATVATRPMSDPVSSPAVTIQPMPRQPAAVSPTPAPMPVAPASWPASPGVYDPYSGPPAAAGAGPRR